MEHTRAVETWLQWGRAKGLPMSEHLQALFPGLQSSPFRVTSPGRRQIQLHRLGCKRFERLVVADGRRTAGWPSTVVRELTLDAFTAAFATLGYVGGADESVEPGMEKVALFADPHELQHMPRGNWHLAAGPASWVWGGHRTRTASTRRRNLRHGCLYPQNGLGHSRTHATQCGCIR